MNVWMWVRYKYEKCKLMNDTPKLKVDGACDVPESRYRRYPFLCPLSYRVRLDNMHGNGEGDGMAGCMDYREDTI